LTKENDAPPDRSAKGSSPSALRWPLLGLGLLVLAVTGFLLLGRSEFQPKDAASVGPGASASSNRRPAPLPSIGYPYGDPPRTVPRGAAAASASQVAECGSACACINAQPCKRSRKCAGGPCDATIRPDDRFRLRLTSVQMRDIDPASVDADTKVCVRVVGAATRACTTVREMRKDPCSEGTPLEVTAGAIVDPGLEVEITAGGKLVGRGAHLAYKSLSQREACIGIRFGGTKLTGDVTELGFFLDEP
jgi:hypothetical protein